MYGLAFASSSTSTIHATLSGVPWYTLVKSHVALVASVVVLKALTLVPSVWYMTPSRT